MEWIKCSVLNPPKDKKFIFSYFAGIGIGEWGQCFKIINGNSERSHFSYILILDPFLIVGDQESPFEWNEEYMKIMEVSWMHLPSPPLQDNKEKCDCREIGKNGMACDDTLYFCDKCKE